MKNWFNSSLGKQDANNDNDNDNDVESGEQTTLIQKIKSTAKATVEVEVNYTMFFIVMGSGALFILISFLYVPFIILYPWKFSAFFSFGSFLFLLSFIFVYGTCGCLEMLFKKERTAFTLLYLLSIIVGNILSHIVNLYIIVLICSGIQLITVSIFTVTFIPGGITGIKFLSSVLRLLK